MKSTWKWTLGIGAAFSVVALVGLLLFSSVWNAPSVMRFSYGIRGGFPHTISGAWAPFSVTIFGAFGLLLIFLILFLVIRTKPKSKSSSEISAKPLEICPGCGANLDLNWKYCPFCDYELL